jgi:single-strand DNA-binding protein
MNVCSFTGNLGKDCRVASVSGTTVCNFTVAAKSGFGDKEQTIWLNCALWGRQAESKLTQYLTKGAQVAVSGELGTEEYEGKISLTLRVGSISLVGGKREGAPGGAAPQGQSSYPAPAAREDYDDDIPF